MLDAKILVVDDSQHICRFYSSILQKYGAKVVSAPSGKQAMMLLTEAGESDSPFKLAVLDITMPDMDGIQLLQEMRALPAGENLPVIMVTGKSDAETVRQCVRLRVSKYLLKPCRPDDLRTSVLEALS